MLLYITTGEARDREVRPLHTIPDTVTQLFYLAMREHARPAAVQHWSQDQWARDPDWRFDRQVIRLALFLQGNLEVAAEDRIAVFGPLRPLWLQVDFAIQGFRGVPVGLQDSLTNDQLVSAIAETDPRVVFATERRSAERLLGIGARLGQRMLIAPYGAQDGTDGVVGIDYLWDRARILDTPERAQNWRSTARQAQPDDLAGIHYGSVGAGDSTRVTFTHGEAMAFVRDRVTRCPAQPDDVGYFQDNSVTAITRKAAYAYVGDGHTVVTMPGAREGVDLRELKVAKLVASPAWLERLVGEIGAGGGGRGRKVREHLRERVGERLRWVEPTAEIPAAVEARLLEAGIPLPALALDGTTRT